MSQATVFGIALAAPPLNAGVMWLDARPRPMRLLARALIVVVLLASGCRPNAVDSNERGVPNELVLDSGRVIPIVELSHDAERGHLELEYVTEYRILEDH
jgi:hypothetical protein